MKLLHRIAVTPYYGQVELGDPYVAGYPQFQTGSEEVVSLPQRLVVATRGDEQGRVVIEIWQNGIDPMKRSGRLAHSGSMCLQQDYASVGNTIGNELHRIHLGAGVHRIDVLVAPMLGEADTVYFVVDPLREQ